MLQLVGAAPGPRDNYTDKYSHNRGLRPLRRERFNFITGLEFRRAI